MRLRMEFSYNGKDYSGYQIQKGKCTVQGEIENTLAVFFDTKINLIASGRTDTGVSALKQVAHFDVSKEVLLTKIPKITDKELQGIAIRLNYMLTANIRILSLSNADDNFHARYNTKEKTYVYNFYLSPIEIPYLSQFCLWLQDRELNTDNMANALKVLEGSHDFSSFCASNTEVKDKVRTIYDASICFNNLGYYSITIRGDGFLYNMVRIIVGTILDVGRGKLTPNDINRILCAKDRRLAGKTVSSAGLVLQDVKY